MNRIQKRRAFLKWFMAAAIFFVGAVFLLRGQRQKTEFCALGKYRNLEVSVSEQREISGEEVKNMMQSLCEERGTERTKELEEMIFQAFVQERLYEAETEKRRAVLRKILKNSKISQDVENPEETLLLAVYEKAGLTLTEREKSEGIRKLQEVFGAASAEELEEFLSAEEQLRIIKKEKTYEYLLKNNHFVTVPAVPLS